MPARGARAGRRGGRRISLDTVDGRERPDQDAGADPLRPQTAFSSAWTP